MKYKIGDIVEGKITGIQPYGAFIKIDEHYKGLIHISELSFGFVKDVTNFVNIDDVVKVKIIDLDSGNPFQLRLSLKALQPNRQRKEKKFQKYDYLPEMKIGFASIAKKMPFWIAQATEEKND